MVKNKGPQKFYKKESFLSKKINLIEKFSISDAQAKKIFWIFSVLLVFDLLILPIVFGYIKGGYSCEYGMLNCTMLTLSPLLIFSFFWLMMWRKIFIIFFMNKEEKDKKRNSKFFLTKLGMKNIGYLETMPAYKMQLKISIIAVCALLCFTIGWLFVYQIFDFTMQIV